MTKGPKDFTVIFKDKMDRNPLSTGVHPEIFANFARAYDDFGWAIEKHNLHDAHYAALNLADTAAHFSEHCDTASMAVSGVTQRKSFAIKTIFDEAENARKEAVFPTPKNQVRYGR